MIDDPEYIRYRRIERSFLALAIASGATFLALVSHALANWR